VDAYDLTLIEKAQPVTIQQVTYFNSSTGHAMLTVRILDSKNLPPAGSTIKVSGIADTHYETDYNGTWEILASAVKTGTSPLEAYVVVGKPFPTDHVTYPPISFPRPGFTTLPTVQACSVQLHGRIVAPEWHRQYFSGFNPGDIRGSFGVVHEVYPEWWGLVGTGHTDGLHDRAINCAIRSIEAGSPHYSPAPFESFIEARQEAGGRVVALAQRTYWISAPVDLSGTSSQLRGAGAARTTLKATSTWDQTSKAWIDCAVWQHVGERPPSTNAYPNLMNHSALVWIGGGFPDSGQSFHTSVRGVTLDGYYAIRSSRAKNGLGRVSGISSKGWVEENTLLEDVSITNFTGLGVGFPQRMPLTLGGQNRIATVNGLTLRNFWITGGIRRDAYPIYFTHHAGVATIQDGTIDCRRTEKHLSAKWQQGSKAIGVLQVRGYPKAGDKVKIDTAEMTFQDTLAAGGDVQIAQTATGASKAGVDYGRYTPPHPGVRATYVSGTPRIDLKAATVGEVWNTYPLLQSGGGSNAIFEHNSVSVQTLVNGSATAKAVATVKFSAIPTNGTWVRIGDVTYKFWSTTLTGTPHSQDSRVDVLIGGTISRTLENLAAAIECKETQESFVNLLLAINGTGTDGTHYKLGSGKIPHPSFNADAPRATQAIGCSLKHLPQSGDSVTIQGNTSTFRNSLVGSGEVRRMELIGSTDLPGTRFSASTAPHPLVRGSVTGSVFTASARTIGHGGNDITVGAVLQTNSTLSWGGAQRLANGSAAVKASASLSGNAVNGDIVTIAGKNYRFRGAGVALEDDGDVRIGADAAATFINLSLALAGAAHETWGAFIKAINGETNDGYYSTGGANANTHVTASRLADNTVLLTAKSYMLDGNDITLAVASGNSELLSGGPFLEGGVRMTGMTIYAKTAGGTLNGRQLKCESGSSNNGENPPAAWTTGETLNGANLSEPDLVAEIPHTGVFAQGEHLYLNNVHIEGVTVGVNVVQSAARSHVTIANVNVAQTSDSRQAFTRDPEGVDIPEPSLARQIAAHPPLIKGTYQPHYWNYSCAVLISRTPAETPGHQNGPDSVTIIGLSARDGCRYLIRDAAYNVELTSYRQGRSTASGAVAFYARGNTSMPAAGVAPYAAYASGFPYNTDAKVYFIGPVVLGAAVYEPVPLSSRSAGPV